MEFSAAPTLRSDRVILEQLAPQHRDDLAAAVAVDEIWRTWYTHLPSPEQMAGEIERRLEEQRADRLAPWAIVDAATGRAVGMTTYLNLAPANRRVEIGSTWIGRDAQSKGINPAAKLLLLQRAFEDLNCIAVEFRTHWHNHQSRAAIARLGAKQDGVLRNNMIWEDGTYRDTVVFSIIDNEWPTVKRALEARLETRQATTLR